jgi:3-methyladenine DNA glycosylase AlkD
VASAVVTIAEARRRLAAHVDPAYKRQLERLVPGVRALGVRVPVLRALARELRADVDAACAFLDAACADGCRELILLGTMRVARHRGALAWPQLVRWLSAESPANAGRAAAPKAVRSSIDNWETCDLLAMSIAAAVVAARLELVDELVALARTGSVWHRRFAVATAAALDQDGRSHPAEALRVCEPVLADREPIVRKAVAWAIREASERDEALAFAFLRDHAHRLPRALAREASVKLSPAHRAIIATC